MSGVSLLFRERWSDTIYPDGRRVVKIDGKRVRLRASKGWRRHVRRLKATRP